MPNLDLVGPEPESTWRRMAGASWGEPTDPTIYGFLDLDARALLKRLEELREQGTRITVTHAVVRAIALVLGRHPELNVVRRRRRVYRRARVDVFVHAALPSSGGMSSAELAGVKVREADRLSLEELAAEMDRKLTRLRGGQDEEITRSRRQLGSLPRIVLPCLLRLVRWLSVEWNLDLHALGVARDPFGSVAVTNVGMLGVDTGFAPLFPIGGPPMVLTVGEVQPRPVVDEDGAVVARPTLRISGTFDHRVFDGFQLATFSRETTRLIEHDVDEL